MYPIGELARKSGFSAKTLRYYDEIGLLIPERRNPLTGFRHYSEEALGTLALIRIAKKAGLKLREIRELLLALRRGTPRLRAKSILEQRGQTLQNHTRGLRDLRLEIERFLRRSDAAS